MSISSAFYPFLTVDVYAYWNGLLHPVSGSKCRDVIKRMLHVHVKVIIKHKYFNSAL
jgi:hypothetical protein